MRAIRETALHTPTLASMDAIPVRARPSVRRPGVLSGAAFVGLVAAMALGAWISVRTGARAVAAPVPSRVAAVPVPFVTAIVPAEEAQPATDTERAVPGRSASASKRVTARRSVVHTEGAEVEAATSATALDTSDYLLDYAGQKR